MRVEGQFPVDEERCDQEHARTAIRCEQAGEVDGMTGVLGLEQWDNHHPLTAGEAMSCTSQPTADDFESVGGEHAAESSHLGTVGRSASGASQNRAAVAQDALKTAARGDSRRPFR